MVIWKFPLLSSRNIVEIPQGARILNLANQQDHPTIWVLVDRDAPLEARTFLVIGTGEEFNLEGLEFIGTAHDIMGWMVLHVFEKVS